MKRRNLILLLGGASSGAMSVGTGAFSSVEAEREVAVNVVEDENAYLGLTAGSSESVSLQVRNQFAGALTLTLTATVQNSSVPVEVRDRGKKVVIDIGSGNDGTSANTTTVAPGNDLDVAVKCKTAGTYDLKLSFHGEVESAGTTVRKSRVLEKTTITAVQFPGNSGNAAIKSSAPGTVDGTAYYQNDGIEQTRIKDQQVNKKFGPNKTAGIDGEVVAVEIDGFDGCFLKQGATTGREVDLRTAAGEEPPTG